MLGPNSNWKVEVVHHPGAPRTSDKSVVLIGDLGGGLASLCQHKAQCAAHAFPCSSSSGKGPRLQMNLSVIVRSRS